MFAFLQNGDAGGIASYEDAPSPVLRMALYLGFLADSQWLLMKTGPDTTKPFSTPRRIAESHIAQVRCDGFRCMAYRDPKGTWRNFFSGEPLEVVEVLSEQPIDR